MFATNVLNSSAFFPLKEDSELTQKGMITTYANFWGT